MVSDGVRWAVWEVDAPRRTRIYDTWTGRISTMRSPRVPSSDPYPPSCVLSGLGGGYVAWQCGSWPAPTTARVMDLRTRRFQAVRGFGAVRRRVGREHSFGSVGRHWMHVYPGGHPPRTFYLAWRTGAVRYVPARRPGSRTLVDLDRPGLTFRLCPGPPTPPVQSNETEFYRFDHPFGLSWVQVGPGFPGPSQLRVDRCGTRKRRIIACRCFRGQLGGGLVTWLDPTSVGVFHLRSGRRRAVSYAGLGSQYEGYVAHTARRVLLGIRPIPTRGDHPPTRLYQSPVP